MDPPPSSIPQWAIVDPLNQHGTWEGWGTSLAWWGKAFGQRDDIADALFTLSDDVELDLIGAHVPGLGLNIVRYNAGASSDIPAGTDDNGNPQYMQTSPSLALTSDYWYSATRLIDTYWLTWEGGDLGTWDWSRDANQRAMLLKAAQRGADTFELFSNSPVWWMLSNKNPSGADNGADENLQSWNFDDHAVYLAEVAAYAKSNWGVSFSSVEPFNEPSADWWSGTTGTQEGCHFEVASQALAVQELRAALDERGLSGVIIAASDESDFDEATETWDTLGEDARQAIGRVNVHGYQYGGGRRDLLYDAVSADSKKLWLSEYAESDGSGLSLASNLNHDFQWLHPTAHVYWQALDDWGWGLIGASNEEGAVFGPETKYFVYAQYTRHIRPGMQIIASGDSNAVAAHSADENKLVIVLLATSNQEITFDLSGFSRVEGPLTEWRTRMVDGGDRYVKYEDGEGTSILLDTSVAVTLEGPAVVTIEVASTYV